jgi:hypothetical protein
MAQNQHVLQNDLISYQYSQKEGLYSYLHARWRIGKVTSPFVTPRIINASRPRQQNINITFSSVAHSGFNLPVTFPSYSVTFNTIKALNVVPTEPLSAPQIISYEVRKDTRAVNLLKCFHQEDWHCLKYIPLHYQTLLNPSFTEEYHPPLLVGSHV